MINQLLKFFKIVKTMNYSKEKIESAVKAKGYVWFERSK